MNDGLAFDAGGRSDAARTLRRRLLRGFLRAAVRIAPHLPDGAIGALRAWASLNLTSLGVGVLGPELRRRFRQAGADHPGAAREFLRQAVLHYTDGLFILKHALASGLDDETAEPTGAPRALCEVIDLVRRRIRLDDSMRILHDAIARRRGVLLAPVHACQFLTGLPLIAAEAPLTVYLRYSQDETDRRAKLAWCRAGGLDVIAERSRPGDPAARPARMAEALAEGRVLVITPDIPQRRGRGVPVRLWNREVHLAAGVASLAVLTGAPVVPVTARTDRVNTPRGRVVRNTIVMHPALEAPTIPRRRGWRPEALRLLQQQWTDVFAEFARNYPHLWLHWLDNRWGRVFRRDSRYTA